MKLIGVILRHKSRLQRRHSSPSRGGSRVGRKRQGSSFHRFGRLGWECWDHWLTGPTARRLQATSRSRNSTSQSSFGPLDQLLIFPELDFQRLRVFFIWVFVFKAIRISSGKMGNRDDEYDYLFKGKKNSHLCLFWSRLRRLLCLVGSVAVGFAALITILPAPERAGKAS